MTNSKFCYTLDVLTDGSEHTGCGTLFLSVWKIPVLIRTAAAAAATAKSIATEDNDIDDSSTSGSESISSGDSSCYEKEEEIEDSRDENDDNDEDENRITTEEYDPYAWLTEASQVDDDTRNNNVTTQTQTNDMTPVSRYALSGVGDATARLCADQRFKLAPTRACFLPDLNSNVDGLSALFLALHGAGSPSLHVVVPASFEKNDDGCYRSSNNDNGCSGNSFIEELATITLGAHKNFDIRTCEVREPSNNDVNTLSWWKVYEDDYLLVHASSIKSLLSTTTICSSISSSLVYLYSFPALTLQQQYTDINGNSERTTKYFNLVLLPPECRDVTKIYERLMQQNLPLIRDGVPIKSIDYVLVLDPNCPLSSLSSLSSASGNFLVTLPRKQQEKQCVDEGILIRSQQLARHFHHRMPWAFVAAHERQHQRKSILSASLSDTNNIKILKSGTSIVLEKSNYRSRKSIRIWDRRKSIWNKQIKEEWTNRTLNSLQSFNVQSPSSITTDENEIDIDIDGYDDNNDPCDTIDENEIQLDDDEDEIEREEGSGSLPVVSNIVDDLSSVDDGPRLIVLGTGCATPSAYRGASGYALVLPADDGAKKLGTYGHHHKESQIYILDCGEGVSTMLSRNCGRITDWAQRIRGIWVSHAHLDHYGGLPTMLRLLHEYRESNHAKSPISTATKLGEEPFLKRPRCSLSGKGPIPWVIAPAKVLRYLDIVLNCRHGRSKGARGMNGTVRKYFEPRLHYDPSIPPGPWIHFENIKVNHNCCPAFGVLIGWRVLIRNRDGDNDRSSTRGADFSSRFLCYSGDTRPSHGLVQACRRALQGNRNNFVTNSDYHQRHRHHQSNYNNLFLIHEATFQDNDANMALKKKHSTINEAFRVACDIFASRVLMTHFSQRYDNNVSTTTIAIAAAAAAAALTTIVPDTNDVANNRLDKNSKQILPFMGLAADGLWIRLD